MSASNSIAKSAAANSRKMLGAMVAIGLLCALLISLTYEGTRPIIETKQAEALQRAIFRVLPGTATTRAYRLTSGGRFVAAEGEAGSGELVYAGFDDKGELTGVAIEASGQGYAGIIRILYGYDPAKEAVVGMYVLESKETPGLGDKIEKDPDFLANFEALDVSLTADGSALKNEVVPVKDGEKEHPWQVDGITGATISSRAIGNMLGKSTAGWVPLIHEQRAVFEPKNEGRK